MTLAAFALAVLALLLAPGPTNTLMAVAGAQGGVGRVVRLLPAEVAGYLAAILPILLLGQQALERWPGIAIAVKLAAALWVLALALRLWGATAQRTASAVSARRIFVTTLLNPKSLIFGLVLLPPPSAPGFAPHLALFCLMVAGVALLWGCGGGLTRAGAGGAGRLLLVQRLASAWLACVALGLVAGVVTA